ncbi:polyketide synthase dehydratase domain-containing protein, partial [Bordetella holmesii]|nr:polyketide synthase dehydratase domain-containing protein [Bordetella holmesii]
MRLPVLFEPACASAIADGFNSFVEIGPHPVLRGYLKDALHTAGATGRILITASRGSDDPEKIHDVAAQLILSGADVDWGTLFPWQGEHANLPAYPWQRERHWHAITAESPLLLTRKRAHPLLGYRHAQHPGLWENVLDTQLQPSLADHVVGEAVVFPGTGFAELALAAALQSHPGDYADIEELEIRAPLLLAASPSKRLRFELDEADGRFRILAREQGSQEPWTPHASGRIRQEAGAIGLGQIPALNIPTRPPDFDRHDHERLTRAVGLDYGTAFRAVAHGWNESADSVLAVLQPDASLAAELASTHLHPALLDCSFQLIIQLLKDDPAIGQGIAFVPAKIGRLSLHAGQGQPSYARARLRRRAPHSLTADFVLFDAQGRPLASVRDARFRSIRLSKGAGEHLDVIDCVLTPRPHPLAPAADNPLQTSALLRDIERMLETTAQRANDRYAQEVDPLLESLCDRLSLEALRAQASGGLTLSAALIERRLRRAPQTVALFEHVLQRCVAAGVAQPAPTGWTLPPDEEGQPTAADIWNSLLREYPDYFPAIYAAGRVGQHLTALLQGKAEVDDIIPLAVTPTAVSRLLLGAETGQQLAAVLEIAQGAPLIGPACCASMDFGVADYSYACPDSQAIDDARHALMDSFPDASAILLNDETLASPAARYDLIIVHCEFDTLHACQQALNYARASLKPDGKLLLRGTHPSPWLDFVFGGRPQWWQGADNVTALPPASRWQQWLHDQGLACEPVIELTASPYTGAYLLLASLPAAQPLVPAADIRRQLILASAAGPDQALAQALHTELQAQGQLSQLASGNTADQLDALIQDTQNRHGPLHDILLLDGWGADSADDAARLHAQVQRCALAAALTQACERTATAATIWIVTRNAGVSMGGGTPQDPAIGDAALWGYGRTLANEASNYRIRLADLPQGTAAIAALAREVRYPDAEDEVLFGALGERFAPRLRVVPPPKA